MYALSIVHIPQLSFSQYYDQILPNVSNETSVLFWRSPTSSGTREDVEQISCACNSTEKHKQQVSRHRHQWAPPSTPPDYWSIGFPTTQEVANINKRAEDMHVDKRRRIENETRYALYEFSLHPASKS